MVKSILRKYRDSIGESGLEKAGNIIGALERIFVLTLVILNQYLGIAIVFTAKSIARFENLKGREFAEYYLIGTFASVLSAMFVGFLVNYLVKLI
ncbi:hypothetical protein DRQ33_05385 [bacterium]|nr:MAG: hypothetical protein DRQ33_05385 [bacterium]